MHRLFVYDSGFTRVAGGFVGLNSFAKVLQRNTRFFAGEGIL
jgi:hypothetical protein